MRKIAYLVSPHGFGHAARACAVMQAAFNLNSDLHFDIFTMVPDWFFRESITGNYTYHRYQSDVGIVQKTPFEEDLPQTVEKLRQFLPFSFEKVSPLIHKLTECQSELVVCDIAPIGISAAKMLGIPSILIENFTWDWIYEGYFPREPGLISPANYFSEIFSRADYHIQTIPICNPDAAALNINPVAREFRAQPLEIRNRLEIPPGHKAVLVTMGGIPDRNLTLKTLENRNGTWFVIPGASEVEYRNNGLILLPHHNGYYHPDLVNACDAVVGKLGYSTIAESYCAGIPFGYVTRSLFRESGPLSEFVNQTMNGLEISTNSFQEGGWIDLVGKLLDRPRMKPGDRLNGAADAARFLIKILG